MTAFGLLALAATLGVFDAPSALEERAESIDGGVLDEPPFVPAATEGSVEASSDAPSEERGIEHDDRGGRSLDLSGRATISLRDFAMRDKEGRNVLRVRNMTGHFDIDALKHGTYRMSRGVAEGVEVTLYRDQTGRVSIVHALSESPPTVRQGLHLPPTEEPAEGPWRIEIGPVQVRDAILNLGFTEKPVVFHVESVRVSVRQELEDVGPMIYIEDVHGEMLEPKPLPKPVRIAYAKGLVRLTEEPLVDLVARTCIGRDELRAHAVVPARKQAVDLTVDSAGIAGALGRLGLWVAGRREPGKLHYHHGPVKIDGGPVCRSRQVPRETRVEERKEAHEKRKDARKEAREQRQEERGPDTGE